MRKVLQIKRNGYWDRALERDLRNEVETRNEFISGMKLRFVVNYLFLMQWLMGEDRIVLKFGDISNCREASYKPFTSTEEYYKGVEMDAEERMIFPL